VLFGVVRRQGDEARVETAARPLPADRLLPLVPPEVRPTEVFRFAAPCAGDACAHFDGRDCRLAMRIVARLPAVVRTLKPCSIRPTCRWFAQEGAAACFRCPQVVTEPYSASELMAEVAQPTDKGAAT
jgi:hypothetical protein